MIKTKQDLKNNINADAIANGIDKDRWFFRFLKILYRSENAIVFRYLKAVRKYEYYHNTNSVLQYWYRFYSNTLGVKYGLNVPINRVGPGLRIPHVGGGTILNCESIGSNCCANVGVVVGRKGEDMPVIGDNVTLCPGCKVIGKVRIGNNVTVAPNSVVIKDVPDNAIVSGVPAILIKYKD